MMDVKITTLKMPIEQIQNAILTVREAHDKLIALEGERAALGAVEAVRERAGEEGVRRRQIALEALDERWAGIVSDAQAAVDTQARAAVEAIDAQVTPNGADIIGGNEGDFALIEHGLIMSADQLARTWERSYFFDKENSIREYTEQVFNNLKTAVDRPHGPAYMQYADTPHEYSRIALPMALPTNTRQAAGISWKKSMVKCLARLHHGGGFFMLSKVRKTAYLNTLLNTFWKPAQAPKRRKARKCCIFRAFQWS